MTPCGLLPGRGNGYSRTVPSGMIRPILEPVSSVSQMLPSSPAAMWYGSDPCVGTGITEAAAGDGRGWATERAARFEVDGSNSATGADSERGNGQGAAGGRAPPRGAARTTR